MTQARPKPKTWAQLVADFQQARREAQNAQDLNELKRAVDRGFAALDQLIHI